MALPRALLVGAGRPSNESAPGPAGPVPIARPPCCSCAGAQLPLPSSPSRPGCLRAQPDCGASGPLFRQVPPGWRGLGTVPQRPGRFPRVERAGHCAAETRRSPRASWSLRNTEFCGAAFCSHWLQGRPHAKPALCLPHRIEPALTRFPGGEPKARSTPGRGPAAAEGQGAALSRVCLPELLWTGFGLQDVVLLLPLLGVTRAA